MPDAVNPAIGAPKRQLKKALDALGYRLANTRNTPRQLLDAGLLRTLTFDDVVCRRMVEHGQDIHFLQVGAFDGIVGDPLRKYIEKYPWRGVMVEPQPSAAGILRRLYQGNDRVTVLQAAIDASPARRTLYTIEDSTAPAWAGGLASFQRENIVKHASLIAGLEAMIREQTVDCVTFDTVMARMPQAGLDLLQIDTEGADGFLLSLFPFDRVKPAIVHWEIKHLSKTQREDCLARLAGFGYRFASSGGEDMMGLLF